MKKLIYILIFIFIFMFIDVNGVNAANLDMKDLTLECIYSDGGLYTSSYSGQSFSGKILSRIYGNDPTDGTYSVNRIAYSLVGVNNNVASKGSNIQIVNKMYVKSAEGVKCNSVLYNKQVQFDWGNDDNNNQKDIPVDYYKFGADIESSDTDAGKGISFGCTLLFGACNDSDANKVDKMTSQQYKLLSERYYLQSTASEPNATVYYVQEQEEAQGEEQATNNKKYASVLVFDNVILLEKDGRITRLEGNSNVFKGVTRDEKTKKLSKDVPTTIYLNSPEPSVVMDSSSNAAYKYLDGQTTYSFTTDRDSTHTHRYALTDEKPDGDEVDDGELCNRILPNTSVQLKKLIKWLQILIPVFLIVLTALDIGKIVASGNIDEELPKRKKIIIIRFVVVLVFFFLPVLVKMVTGWLKNSGGENTDKIQYIDCLFK